MHPLKKWRLDNDLTQEALAEELDCTHVTISRYENWLRWPSPTQWAKLDDLSSGVVNPTAALKAKPQEAAE